MKKKKLTVGYSPWGWAHGELGPFSEIFTDKVNIAYGFKDFDCLLLWGGEDIHPSYYHEPPHKNNETYSQFPSERDVLEWKAMLYCKAHNKPMIGICRGAQFVCVFAGGKLAQDVDRHQGTHGMRTLDGRVLSTTSVHHQMMNPYQVNHELLGWAFPARSNFYEDGYHQPILDLENNHEPEVVFFPHIRGLAIQGHPEYSHATPEYQKFCVDMAKKYLFSTEVVS